MDKQEVPFSVELIQKMLDCHRRIGALKVRFLMVVESPGVTDRQKLELKNGLAALAADLDRHFGEAKFRSVTPYNLHEVERLEGEYLLTIEKTVAELEKSARRLVPSPEGQSQVPAAAADIDRRLLAARIFEEPALEKDKLDHLNAVLGFLLARAGASPRAASPETIGEEKLQRELEALKLRNYQETLAGAQGTNLDILYKVKGRVERALRDKLKVNLSARELDAPERLNHDELYLQDRGSGNFRLFYKRRSLAFELCFALVDTPEPGTWAYRGELSGWAEAGVDRVAFVLKDDQTPGTLNPQDLLMSRSISDFLARAELLEVYRALREICREKSEQSPRLERRVEEQMKQKVSRALDAL